MPANGPGSGEQRLELRLESRGCLLLCQFFKSQKVFLSDLIRILFTFFKLMAGKIPMRELLVLHLIDIGFDCKILRV